MMAWRQRDDVGAIGLGVHVHAKDTRSRFVLFSERNATPIFGLSRSLRGPLLVRLGPWLVSVGRSG